MTKQRDFERIVRTRMAKTGESYTAARAHLVAEMSPTDTRESRTVRDAPIDPGMSDDAVHNKTGKTWAEWVVALDAHGARALSHAEIAKLVRAHWPEVGDWWTQAVTVGFERLAGLRAAGQLCTGAFAASKSKTFAVPMATLFAAFSDEEARDGWLGEATTVRTSHPGRSMRMVCGDGTTVDAWFTDKGPAKSSVSVQHGKLPDASRRDTEKLVWAERFAALTAQLTPPAP